MRNTKSPNNLSIRQAFIALLLLTSFLQFNSCQGQKMTDSKNKSSNSNPSMKLNKLSPQERHVIIDKGTDRPFTGEYTDHFEKGTYTCRQCDAELYTSDSKFHSGCGWPSFDQEIEGAVKRVPDVDGSRTEIICARCKGHLGHVFIGEHLTEKNTRHCVNTSSMKFIKEKDIPKEAKAIFAGGCFWGVEYYFQGLKGVKSTQVGYIGGSKENPTYKEVSYLSTGHYEALEVRYDPKVVSYEDLAKLFFEIHDPTQADGQGNDIGSQYLSAVFYADKTQKEIAEKLIKTLNSKGYKVATKLIPATKFWSAEDYHQKYYEKTGGTPYCHKRVKRF